MRTENCSCGLLLKVATFLIKVSFIFSLLPSVSAGQQPLLQITSPANGAIVSPGQNLSVAVSSPAGATFAQVDVIGESPIGMSTVAASVPTQFSIAIPSDIAPGQYRLTAEGTTVAGQDAHSASITIDVERPDLPNSLSSLLSGIILQTPAQTTPFIVLATFSDGSVLDVSGSPYLTYSSANTSVATVDTNGMVTAVAPGNGFITATYTLGGNNVQISVPVSFPHSGVGTGTTNFFISITPGTQSVVPGSSTTFTISINSYNGFTGAVALSLGGLPNGVTANFSPTSVNVSGTSALTISTLQSTPLGTYVLTITGTSGSLNPSVSASLAVGTSGSPNITSLSPTSGPVGTSVTISGANFGSTQGTSTVTFNGTTATPTSWSASSIVAPVPTGATTGSVAVTVGGVATNSVSFAVTTSAPSIATLNPTSGAIGTSVTITGTNFGSTQGTSTVKFNGTIATPTSWSTTSIVAPVPTGATTGSVIVTVGGAASNGVSFTVVSRPVAYVQGNSATQWTTQSALMTLPYTAAQTAGNLNLVVVSQASPYSPTATISSVTDTRGNIYVLAAGPTVRTTVGMQAIYYAKNIAAAAPNANVVTVTFASAADYPRIRIVEYSGLDTANPLDASVSNQGTPTPLPPDYIIWMSSSGSVTTTNANDLLVGANSVDYTSTWTSGPGTGYTSRITSDGSVGDILEDELVHAAGSYSATAPLAWEADFIMQMVAFRAATH